MPSIFVLGVTGYVGGSVLVTLLQEIQELKATALVRDEAQIGVLSKHGVNCVKGTNQDPFVVTELASKADIILNAADTDDAGLLKAILKGCNVHEIYMHPYQGYSGVWRWS